MYDDPDDTENVRAEAQTASSRHAPVSRPAPVKPNLSRRTFLRTAGTAAAGGVVAIAGYEVVRSSLGSAFPSGLTGSPPANLGASAAPSSGQIAVGEPRPTPHPAPADDGPAPAAAPRQAFRSRPDLQPPALLVGAPPSGVADGLLFLTPNNGEPPDGPTIYDDRGELVWARPMTGDRHATALRVIELDGEPALAWWEGTTNGGVGSGELVIVDRTYREVTRVQTDGRADLHELDVQDGVARYLEYRELPFPHETRLSPSFDAPDLPADAPSAPPPERYFDCAIVEVEIATGARIFEWHTADHIDLTETYAKPNPDAGRTFDPVHANAVELDSDGTLLLSARNTSAVYKIDRSTGQILWRLGGRRNQFQLGEGVSFGLQHDIRRQSDGTLTLFDNREPPDHARGLVLRVDEQAMIATLVRELRRPVPLQVASQGNLQVLTNGNILVGWGSQPTLTEFAPDGGIAFDATMPAGIQSYRDRRFVWSGMPLDPPDVAADPLAEGSGSQQRVTAYASWNGATGVAAWRLLAGPDGAHLPIATAARTGFETAITGVVDDPAATSVSVTALDAAGNDLATSRVVRIV
jgi:Arylsulfotransferase (ASST)